LSTAQIAKKLHLIFLKAKLSPAPLFFLLDFINIKSLLLKLLLIFVSVLSEHLFKIKTNLKKNVTLFAMFDSCFSGSVLDLKYQYLDSLNYDNYTENNKELETLGNVFMISGCTDCQTSADSVFNNKLNGAMTWALLESLNQNSNFTWRELVKNMRQNLKSLGYSQIPQFSTGKFENIDLKVFI